MWGDHLAAKASFWEDVANSRSSEEGAGARKRAMRFDDAAADCYEKADAIAYEQTNGNPLQEE